MTAMKQLNVRIPAELRDALTEHKALTGEEISEVVRRGIEIALSPTVVSGDVNGDAYKSDAPVERASGQNTPPSLPPAPEGPDVDFAEWLRGRTGIPRALLHRRIAAGNVTIDGETVKDERVPLDRLKGVVALGSAVV